MTSHETLEKFLSKETPKTHYKTSSMETEVPGWAFFEGTMLDERGSRYYWVVRDDGSVVTEDRLGELGKIYRSLEVLNKAQNDETISSIAVALLVSNELLISDFQSEELGGAFEGNPITAAKMTKTHNEGRLVFWTRTVQRNTYYTRHEITIPPSYKVTHQKSRPDIKLIERQ